MNALNMFNELGYDCVCVKGGNDHVIANYQFYKSGCGFIEFDLEEHLVKIDMRYGCDYSVLRADEVMAINQMCKELGWIR